MTVPLHLLRHGEPSLTGHFLGRTDLPLSAHGLCHSLDQLQGLTVDRVISSGLRRTDSIAAAFARMNGIAHDIDRRWRELDFGQWDGKAADELPEDDLHRFWEDPDRFPPPGGEAHGALLHRVGQAIKDLAPVPSLVIAHGGSIRAALVHLCGFSRAQCWAIHLGYGTRVDLVRTPGDSPGAILKRLTP